MDDLERLAALIREQNRISNEIATLAARPEERRLSDHVRNI